MLPSSTVFVFDIGGVLGRNYQGAGQHIAEKTGISATEFDKRSEETYEYFCKVMMGQRTYAQYLGHITKDTGWAISPAALGKVISGFICSPFDHSALSIAKKLKARGHRLAIFSDNVLEWINHFETTRTGKFLELFDDLIFSFDIHAQKITPGAIKTAYDTYDIKIDDTS